MSPRIVSLPVVNTPHLAVPSILLVGAGRFGRQHLETWRMLARQGIVRLAGVVVRSVASRDALAPSLDVPVYADGDDVPDVVDAVDIVTPIETHVPLVERWLAHADVLVEKPLAASPDQAKRLARIAADRGRILMVNHIYRFHAVTRELRRQLAALDELPRDISGCMLNPVGDDVDRGEPNLEFLHFFDLLDELIGRAPLIARASRHGRTNVVSLRYPRRVTARLKVGWEGDARIRELRFVSSHRQIVADFAAFAVTVEERSGASERIEVAPYSALERSLRAFVESLHGRKAPVTAAVGARVVDVATRAVPAVLHGRRPAVAVIGGGIFGATCALELAPFCDVTLFERHPRLFGEATYYNQWRHHSGFHYPRSQETVDEILACRAEFEERYRNIIAHVPSYYCPSATGLEITAERYLEFCRRNKLNYRIGPPPVQVVDLTKVSVCLRTDEAVLDFHTLSRDTFSDLRRANVSVRTGAEIVSGTLLRGGIKELVVRCGGDETRGKYDFVINATYANSNLIARLFGFPLRPLRFDLLELLVLRVPLPLIAVTVLDGPFTSLVSTGTPGEFMLSHIHESVLSSVVTGNGRPPRWGRIQSNRTAMLREAKRYFPVLDQATYIESRFGTRTVRAYSADFDGRPTVVTNHGFGCWSVLGGKIVTSVSNAREIASDIRLDLGIAAPVPQRSEPSGFAIGARRQSTPR